MRKHHQRLIALLLATFYLGFVGGIEFMHHHDADGVLFGDGPFSLSLKAASSRLAWNNKKPVAHSSDSDACAACQWAQNGHASTPIAIVPTVTPALEYRYVLPTLALRTLAPESSSSRGPPLS